MKLLVCGGRRFGDIPERRNNSDLIEYERKVREYKFIHKKIEEALEWNSTEEVGSWLPPNGTMIISGAATGADRASIDWAVVHWCPFKEYFADWKRWGRKAGILRNIEMLDQGEPDKVLAFPGGNGTAHMVRIAKEAGVPVTEVEYVGD